jgi:hypothetical protein
MIKSLYARLRNGGRLGLPYEDLSLLALAIAASAVPIDCRTYEVLCGRAPSRACAKTGKPEDEEER